MRTGEGCGGLWCSGPLFFHGGWTRRAQHVWPLPGAAGEAQHPAPLRPWQQDVQADHRGSLPRLHPQAQTGLQVSGSLPFLFLLPAGLSHDRQHPVYVLMWTSVGVQAVCPKFGKAVSLGLYPCAVQMPTDLGWAFNFLHELHWDDSHLKHCIYFKVHSPALCLVESWTRWLLNSEWATFWHWCAHLRWQLILKRFQYHPFCPQNKHRFCPGEHISNFFVWEERETEEFMQCSFSHLCLFIKYT